MPLFTDMAMNASQKFKCRLDLVSFVRLFSEKGFLVSFKSVYMYVCVVCILSLLRRYWSKSNVIGYEIDVTLSSENDWVAANLVSRRHIKWLKKKIE